MFIDHRSGSMTLIIIGRLTPTTTTKSTIHIKKRIPQKYIYSIDRYGFWSVSEWCSTCRPSVRRLRTRSVASSDGVTRIGSTTSRRAFHIHRICTKAIRWSCHPKSNHRWPGIQRCWRYSETRVDCCYFYLYSNYICFFLVKNI